MVSRRTVLLSAAGALAAAGCSAEEPTPTGPVRVKPSAVAPSPPTSTASPAATGSRTPGTLDPDRVEVAVERLDQPWGLGFLPDGGALISLNGGDIVLVPPGGQPQVVGHLDVDDSGEGGLLGLAVSPHFADDARVFVYHSTPTDNRIERLLLRNGSLTQDATILDAIPHAGIHNGGRIAFGPDELLYVATGDASERPLSQQRDSLAGKILRITPDGQPGEGNPFGTRVWSYGHRNVQGLAWAPDSSMYASELGADSWDEFNRITPGGNYGWPDVEGLDETSDTVPPLLVWKPADASPSGIAVTGDNVAWMAALRGQRLWRIPLDGSEPTAHLIGTYGRLRTVEVGPDGRLWVLTSNRFRGQPAPTDDRLLLVG